MERTSVLANVLAYGLISHTIEGGSSFLPFR